MNVYTCWYNGNFGYGCRTRSRRWMFVPELGQPDHKVYKNLTVHDLIFKNPFDKKLELVLEHKLQKSGWWGLLKRLLFTAPGVQTVGGLLFTSF